MDSYRMTPDGVQARALDKEERNVLEAARARMGNVRAPVLLEGPQDRLFFVGMEAPGTAGNKTAP